MIKFAYVESDKVIPDKIRKHISKPIVVIRNPILEEYDLVSQFEIKASAEETNLELREALRAKVDYLDTENIGLYAAFKKPIVAIVVTHPTISNIERNKQFYAVVVKFIYQGGFTNHPDMDYVILSGIDIKDVVYDFQLDDVNRNFHLVIMKDGDTGYRYEDIVIREEESMPLVKTADTINSFIKQYKAGTLRQYLKT